MGGSSGSGSGVVAAEDLLNGQAEFKTAKDAWTKAFAAELKAAGYPLKADPAKVDKPRVVFLLWVLVRKSRRVGALSGGRPASCG